MITQARLKEVLSYCPDNGIFTKRITGKAFGNSHNRGYLKGYVDGATYLLHRLAFLYVTGSFPNDQVDHINQDKKDNRWANLRDVSHSENHKNMPMQSNNSSGVTGVHYAKNKGTWVAYIKVNNKRKHLGSFLEKGEAVQARCSAMQDHNFHVNHGV
jgi:hypothetical protein